jgi:hypothetical protein
LAVPTIHQSRNLKIQVYADDHNPPHFHVVTPDYQAQVRIDNLSILRGDLRRADYEEAKAWAEEHKEEIRNEWNRLNQR